MIEKLQAEMIEALKAKNKVKLGVLRMLLADIKKTSIDSKKTLTDQDILSIIRKNIKSRQEAIKMYTQGNRSDLVDKETAEIAILEVYLPQQLSEEEINSIIDKEKQDLGLQQKKDMGKIMKSILGKYGASIDGKKLQQLVVGKLD